MQPSSGTSVHQTAPNRGTLRCAVVGAGMSGLSCAQALQLAGHQVSVFEKSRGASGRMSTRRGDDWQCDHGAQYFTAHDPAFQAEVARWQQAGVAALWQPRLQVLGGPGGHGSASDVATARFVGMPRMTAPGNFLASNLSVTPQTTITQLQQHADGWELSCKEQAALAGRFDVVLLAVPAPQAVALLAQTEPVSGEGVELLADVASSAKMRACWTLMLRFAAPVDLPFDAAFINHGPLRWIARDSGKPGRAGLESWSLHANAEWSEAHLEYDANSVAALLLQAFEDLGGAAPQAWTAHRWLYADTKPALHQQFAWSAKTGLGLCGDWLNGGKVEGAWLSGRALAQQVMHVA